MSTQKCNKCGSFNIRIKIKLPRCVDEGTMKVCICQNCNHRIYYDILLAKL